MPEFIIAILQHPFTWGLILGFAGGAALWIQTIKNARELKSRNKELESKLQHADETLSRVQRAGEDAHRRELGQKDDEITRLRDRIEDLKEAHHKLELKLQKEKSEGTGFLGKVRDKLVGPTTEKRIEDAEVVEAETVTTTEDDKSS
jgi:predicted nuclease with TOPRIM domain